jgi:hypothetical protein
MWSVRGIVAAFLIDGVPVPTVPKTKLCRYVVVRNDKWPTRITTLLTFIYQAYQVEEEETEFSCSTHES